MGKVVQNSAIVRANQRVGLIYAAGPNVGSKMQFGRADQVVLRIARLARSKCHRGVRGGFPDRAILVPLSDNPRRMP